MNYTYHSETVGTRINYARDTLRVYSEVRAQQLVGKSFPIVELRNARDNSKRWTVFHDTTLVVLLSPTGCAYCQERELRNLDTLYRKLKPGVGFIAIERSNSRYSTLDLTRRMGIQFSFWFGCDSSLLKFNSVNKYPLILVLKGQMVVGGYLPIPSDDQFSIQEIAKLTHILCRYPDVKPPTKL